METERTKDINFRLAAFIAAISLLLMIIAAIFADSLRTSLLIESDAEATVKSIIEKSSTLRLSIFSYIVVIILDVLVAWALYVYFKPINSSLSLLAAWFRLIYATLFFVAIFNLINVVQLTSNSEKIVQTQVTHCLQAFTTQWNVSFVFFGIHLGLLGLLAIKTKQINNIFGILLLAAGFGYSMDGLGKVLIPDYSLSLIKFTFIGEVLLMLWLFIKGTKTQPITKNENNF